MDAFARGLKIAAGIRADGRIEGFVKNRYASWNSDLGKQILAGKASFTELEKIALSQPSPTLESGGQEYLENILNELL
jgi:xylose isomerase